MRKKQDLRIMKTKASLYRGFMSLLKTKSFEDISISNICSASLINRSTYYDHFNDKYELLQSMFRDMHEEFLKELEIPSKKKDVSSTLLDILSSFLQYVDDHVEVYSSIVNIENHSIAKDLITDVLIRSADSCIKNIYPKESSISYSDYMLFYASGFSSMIAESLKSPHQFDSKSLLEQMKLFIQK